MIKPRLLASLIAVLLLNVTPGATAQEVLRAVTAMPRAVEHTKSFQRFVDALNAAGAGVVEIRIIGGPEVIPPGEQADALRRGVIDVQHGPSSYYLGQVPEGDALVGARFPAPELRARGAYDLLQPIFEDRLNARILGHFDTDVHFHIYMTRMPTGAVPGGDYLTGIKLRSQPIYREFFVKLGATPVSIPVSDAYTAFARGTVDGTGWPELGITDLSWDDYLKVRIDPPFFQTDVVTLINAERWKTLSPEARKILKDTARRHEETSIRAFHEKIAEEQALLLKGGMQVIEVTGPARRQFLDMAYAVPWQRLKARNAEDYDALRAAFYGEDEAPDAGEAGDETP